jgi:hypothetical protein
MLPDLEHYAWQLLHGKMLPHAAINTSTFLAKKHDYAAQFPSLFP